MIAAARLALLELGASDQQAGRFTKVFCQARRSGVGLLIYGIQPWIIYRFDPVSSPAR